ncbi:alpha keto acid dehydrogenase complex, E2 component, dihydrolipoamide acetyltransferase [Myxococcus stipitatus DSM 14675]|uniref:Dihydrolipoamide acetyltransferase component of pyruvate dehydrogenase complex n=1 Tax=Myxococcus stipitatus (strain DSM 14675 / JCM 12634 / Mx s8) TaxID=1278073 RepID=L7UCN0_MYXSD|nr:2-oxo acid dehydrogenase subunit E2 [Myxococcus stipitatus]AGC45625.1 alpha keto acid dehydrogenase complex, E2 component, dihydrolipoamide acetyltransferase [Myxococcus stipitatus DSM 14675]
MGFVYVLPDLGEGVAEAEIVRWFVADGERVEEDAPMVEVMTAKATVMVPAPGKGVALRLLAGLREKVSVGMPLIVIGEPGEDPEALLRAASAPVASAPPSPEPPAVPAPSARKPVQALPRVRKLAEQLGVVLESLQKQGAITEDDVRAAAKRGGPSPVPRLPQEGVRSRIPLSGLRRVASAHLSRAQAVPSVAVVEEASFDTLLMLQQLLGVSYVPFLIQAVVAALREVPEANALFDEATEEVVLYERVDVAIAVHTDEGLAVPVIRDCAKLSLQALEARVQELGNLARARTLNPAESTGGTFTITSPGDQGSLLATPLLNVPQVAILGLHRPTRRPLVVDGELRVGTGAHVTVTVDHRVLDGVTACRFIRLVTGFLSQPLQAFAEGVFHADHAVSATPPEVTSIFPPLQSYADGTFRADSATSGNATKTMSSVRTGVANVLAGDAGGLARELLALDARRRKQRLETFIEAELSKRMGGKKKPLERGRTWRDLGLDSLIAVGLRDALALGLGRGLPATLLFNRPTLASLSEYLLAQLESTPREEPAALEAPVEFLLRLKGLPEREAVAMLSERIATMGDS